MSNEASNLLSPRSRWLEAHRDLEASRNEFKIAKAKYKQAVEARDEASRILEAASQRLQRLRNEKRQLGARNSKRRALVRAVGDARERQKTLKRKYKSARAKAKIASREFRSARAAKNHARYELELASAGS